MARKKERSGRPRGPYTPGPLSRALHRKRTAVLRRALEKADGDISAAGRRLGISKSWAYYLVSRNAGLRALSARLRSAVMNNQQKRKEIA